MKLAILGIMVGALVVADFVALSAVSLWLSVSLQRGGERFSKQV